MRTMSVVATGLLAVLGGCTSVGVSSPGTADASTLIETSSDSVTYGRQQPRGGQPSRSVPLKSKMLGFRFGPFYPSDSNLSDIDNSIQRYGVEFTTRYGGPEGHMALMVGFEWWKAKGNATVGSFTRPVQLDQVTMPVSFLYNTASLAEWSEGKFNLYAGGGVQLTSVYQQTRGVLGAPIYGYEGGWGLQVEGGLALPLGKLLYVQGFARYEWVYPWSSNSIAGGIDELGGVSAGIEVGFRL